MMSLPSLDKILCRSLSREFPQSPYHGFLWKRSWCESVYEIGLWKDGGPDIPGFGGLGDIRGFMLVVILVFLSLLSLLGIWALNTSSMEIQIAGNQQRYEENFSVAEGGSNSEATRLGYNIRPEYNVTDPTRINFDLTAGSYNDCSTWPTDNLIPSGTDNKCAYGYFVTYLYPDIPPKGYDADAFSAYKFRIDGEHQVVIEMGGKKIGVKSTMF